MKTFNDLKIGDRIYTYRDMKISYWTITNLEEINEKSVSYTWDHKEIIKLNKFVKFTYINTKGKEDKFECTEKNLTKYELKIYGVNIYSDRIVAIKHVTDLYDYRVKVLKDLEGKYEKERSYIERYKECLKNLPD